MAPEAVAVAMAAEVDVVVSPTVPAAAQFVAEVAALTAATPTPGSGQRNIFGESISPAAETLLMRADELPAPEVLAVPALSTVQPATPAPAASVPVHADGHHEDIFFAGGAAAGTSTTALGRAAPGPGVDLIDLKHVLDELKNADGRHIAPIGTSPTGFSMVTRLHRPDKKRWLIMGGVVVVLAAAAAVVMATLPPTESEPRVKAPVVAAGPSRKADPAPAPKPSVPPPRPDSTTVAVSKPDLMLAAKSDGAVANPASGASVAPATPGIKTAKPKSAAEGVKSGTATPDATNHGLTKEQFAALTEDDVGKQEIKLEFDPGAAARKAADESAAKQRVAASTLAQDVARAFGKKATQFKRCSDGNEERVKLQFTVQPTGKVADTHVDGTTSTTKAQCLTEILGRAIFPAGSEPATYNQVVVL